MIEINYTIGLLKPDCLKRGIEEEVLAIIEAAGLEVVVAKRVRLTKREVDIIWASCVEEDFYEELLAFFLSSDCIVFIAKGNNAINRLSDLVGYYESTQAREGTIRHRLGKSAMENVIHSTITEETFWREAALFFTRPELKRLLVDLRSRMMPEV